MSVSNTPDPTQWPALSPAGYPYFYALQPDGKGGTTVYVDGAGQPVRSVVYDAHTFPNDVAVAAYIAASAASASQVRVDQYGSCNFAGKVPAPAASLDDCRYLWHMETPFRLSEGQKVRNAGLWYCILSGSQMQINSAVNLAGGGDVARTIRFNPATYTGQMVKKYNDLVAGINAGTITPTVCDSATGNTVG
jgi:hypothetical protein